MPQKLKIKRDLPGSWSLIGILWVIALHLGITWDSKHACAVRFWSSNVNESLTMVYNILHQGMHNNSVMAVNQLRKLPYRYLCPIGLGMLEIQQGGHVFLRCRAMTHRIPIKLQLPGKSRLIFNSISSSLHPGFHEISKPHSHERPQQQSLLTSSN